MKPFSENISTGSENTGDHFQTEFELRAWAKIIDPSKILRQVPEQHWTSGQRAIIGALSVEDIRKFPGHLRTPEMEKKLRAGRETERTEALIREAQKAVGEGNWSRWVRAGKAYLSFPGLKLLAQRGKAVIAERAVEKIEDDLKIGRMEIATAFQKAARREKLSAVEAKIMRRIVRMVPMARSVRFGEYYHPDVGWY